MTNKEYHNQPELSASDIKRFAADKEDFLYWYGRETKPTAAMEFGTEVHDCMEKLCKGEFLNAGFEEAERQAFGENPNRRTKAYQEWKTLNDGLISEAAVRIAKKLKMNFDKIYTVDYELAMVEESFFHEYRSIGVKTRPDLISGDTIVDWKTTKDIPNAVNMRRAVDNFRYDLQAGFYGFVLELIGIHIEKFVFGFVRTKEPFQIGFLEIENLQPFISEAKEITSLTVDYLKNPTDEPYLFTI